MKNPYGPIFAYLKERRQWCWLALLVIAEMVVFTCLNSTPSDSYGQYVDETSGKYSCLLAFIFLENLKGSLFMILLGSIPFGFGVIACTYTTIQGLVSTAKWLLPNIGWQCMLMCTIPHGLFEIPAICFSVLLSMLWCRVVTLSIIRLFRRKPTRSLFVEDGTCILKSIVFIQLPLLLISGILEVTVSYWIAGRVM